MKKLRTLLSVMVLLIAMTAWGQGPVMGKEYTVPMTLHEWGNDQIPSSAILADAQSVKVKVLGCTYVKFFNGATTYKEFKWSDSNKSGVCWDVNDATVLAALKNGYISLNVGGFADATSVSLINYSTSEGAANDVASNSFGGNTDEDTDEGDGDGDGNEGGGNIDPTSLTYKIAHKQQLTNVPTIYITVPDAKGKELKTVLYKDRTTNTAEYHTATIQVVDNSEPGSPQHLDSFTDYVQIKVRGNSTADPDKKPYRLKFAKEIKDENGTVIANCQKHDLLGQGYSKRNWALMANYFDRSMIRNALTYHLGKYLGMDFCPGYKFVDVVINGDYRGTYQITDHVEAGTDRVNIDEDNDWMIETVSWSNMLDTDYGIAVNSTSSTNSNITIPYNTNVKNPEPADDAAWAKLKDDVITWEREWNTSFQNSSKTTGWQAYNDVESFIKYYLAMNITDDYDGFFVMKGYRKPDGPFFWGPIWDKDLAYGNCTYTPSDPHLTEEIDNGQFRWRFIEFLHKDCAFMSRVKHTLDKLIADGVCEKLCKDVDDLTALIDETKTLNYNKWSLTGDIGIGTCAYSDYSQHATQLKTFLNNRFNYLEERIHTMCSDLGCEDFVDDDPEDTPVGDLGALVDLGDGKFSYTGSASTFKEGTEITIATTEGTTLSNYITEGNAWNSTKRFTLTADDVTALAANSYTFYMQATGGEVTAVTVKVPAEQGGLSMNGTQWGGTIYNYKFTKSEVKEGAKVHFTLSGTGNFYADIYATNSGTQDYGIYGSQTSYTRTLTADDVDKIIANNYSIKIIAYNCTSISVEVVGASSSDPSQDTTPTYTLTLTASEGGTVTGAGTYDEGTTVLIKAIPSEGYKFSNWSDDNTNAVRSVTVNEAITLTATFVSDDTPDTPAERQQLTNLPTIYLDAEEVDGSWRGAAMEVFDGENKLGQGTTWTKTTADVSVQYQGSGNKNKDSYRLKFESKIKLIGANKYKQWVLLANDDDPSMINNALAKELGDAVGMPWTPGYQFVDLYVNNEYMGTYQVTDRVKAEDGRSLVSGGNKDADWQVRLNDNTELDEDGTSDYITAANGVNVIYKNPDPKDLTVEQLFALQSDMKEYFDNVFTKTDGTYPYFAENVDKQQLINWYICQEILSVYKGFSSIEAYRSITPTAADNLLHFGPLWDSEKAFGNLGEAPAMSMADKETANSYLGLMTNYAAYGEMKDLFTYLWTQSWFGSGVRDKWNTLTEGGLLTTLKDKADAISATLSESQPKNAEKWAESLGGAENYSATITNIKNYLTTRFDYLDTKFNARAASLCEHTFTYVDNGGGTHKHYCTKCEYTDVESEAHTLTMVSGKAKCSVCELDVTAEVTGTEGEKVYILDAGKSSARYITKTGGFTPDANQLYAINEKPEEGVEFDNVYWTVGTDNYADNIVVTDGTPWAGTVKVSTKKASYSRAMSATSKWGTVCIPFRAGSNDDITFYEISGCSVTSDGIGTISFAKVDYTGGLNPAVYMKNDNASTTVTFTSKAKEDEGYVTFKAPSKMSKNTTKSSNFTFYGNVLESQVVATTATANPALYGISNNKFVHATKSLTVAPFRAYFSYDAGTGTAAKSFAPKISLDSEETSVAGVMSERNALAIFCNGGGSVTLIAPCDMTVTITDLSGKYIKAIPATANERYDIMLPVGINIINSLKVTVR